VKVMLPGLVYGERMWDRFLAEARTAAKLDHPNIVYIHSVKEKDRFLFFVMKYIDGRSLDDILARHRPLPIPVAQTILVEVARALDYAHREGVVHRDIKPANIMIDQKGAAIVMDFGIARAVDTQHFTQTGATIGTPAYMSPEQCHGDDTTAASDQYSLGILAYEMLGGTPPFKGTPIELQIAHMQDVPVPLRDLRPDLSLELSGAVMRMLEKRPQDRWPSLQHLVPIFGRGLDAHDEAPRNHLISLVRSATPRRKSFPPTPISPTPLDLSRATPLNLSRLTPLESRTPVTNYRVRPSSPTTPVSTAELAAAEDELAKRSAEAAIVSGSRDAPTVISGPKPAPGAAAPQSSRGAPAATSPARARSRRTAAIVAGAVVLLGVAGVLATRGTKAPPVAAPPPSVDSTPAAPTAAAVVEAALGDSVVIGHGADATAKVAGKAPRVVSPDAIALIQLSLARSRIAVGDTVHAKIEAFDDAGQRVTTPQMVQSTSNPRVVKFAGPGELVGVKEGKATLTVSAGATSATREVTVGAKSEGRRAKSAPQKKGAPGF
jgi:serine/threonine protein kinase